MKIDHIALFCRDLEAMRQFFLDYFEAESNKQYHNPRTGLRTYILSFTEGSTRLELMQRPDVADADPSVADADPSVAATGYIHISIAVGSKRGVDLLTRRLADDGYPVVSGPRTTGDGYYESCILGPEGVQIEVTE